MTGSDLALTLSRPTKGLLVFLDWDGVKIESIADGKAYGQSWVYTKQAYERFAVRLTDGLLERGANLGGGE